MNSTTKDVERVQRPKLPKKRLLKRLKKKSRVHTAYDGAAKAKPENNVRKREVKLCPKCGSIDIYWARGLPQLWSIWECRHCGYYGAFVIKDGKLAEKLREDFAKKTIQR